ncbi:DNA-binding E3 ubiquitin-protein ligase SNT2 KNAG_0F01890 [Huiozyma naganishii CBS 8797]|uniref:PHD-type domain-containing protein n=1 Tax=Huiozyma naganishii (strain ATCC MYA-139 / BCRC 22969 / CBS 8797 / KCTC 17520 / NBRC 10181 / NCYC 3082 / Yp74L-3) TaxID=1071383 RepID=J7S017_HUIN7|nr:hypothetical protein KNAG_0F01890 [Kazachstania naganishii CBS 8797]CCK70857.1 hypothetical protein KNAG_0F01890 [Kazachstania naganishii CBS 8797]
MPADRNSNDQHRHHRRRSTLKQVNYDEAEVDLNLERSLVISQSNEVDDRNRSGSGTSSKKSSAQSSSGVVSRSSQSSLNSNSSNSGTTCSKGLYSVLLNDKTTPWNFIPTLPPSYRKTSRFSNVLELDDAMVDLRTQKLYNSDSTLLHINETIYMISEPPGDPYYIGRIVEFVVKAEFKAKVLTCLNITTSFPAKYFQVRMNWYYRPRDIEEKITVFNPRLVFASLHQDLCPISSYRGKCTVLHKDELLDVLPNGKESIVRSNVFYFNSLFDRYTKKYYRVHSTDKMLNNIDSTSPFLYSLNKRFRYIYVEEKYPIEAILAKYVLLQGKQELITNVTDPQKPNAWDRRCQNCKEWTHPGDCVECDDCGRTLHLLCMDPPREKNHFRGKVWVCFNCVKTQENTPETRKELAKDQKTETEFILQCKEKINRAAFEAIQKNVTYNTDNCWFQYLGEYSISFMTDSLEESIFFPYPFKGSRIGPKYQWSHCIHNSNFQKQEYRNTYPGTTSDDLVERGTNETAKLLWKVTDTDISEAALEEYITKCKEQISPLLSVNAQSCNLLDFILYELMQNNYDTEIAFLKCKTQLTKECLQEPTFTDEEIKRFEDGVRKHGSELRPVCEMVGTQPMPMIVRFYYNWKKTKRGLQVRGKKNKHLDVTENSSINDIATLSQNDVPILARNETPLIYVDDSSFDMDRLSFLNTSFQCMFCAIDYSAMWYKVTGGSDDDHVKSRIQTGVLEKTELAGKSNHERNHIDSTLGALCIRCARLWRRYAVKWVQPLEVIKRMYGTSVATYHNKLDLILEEQNINKLTLSPVQAQSKYLEWELVQDAELVTRQRLEIAEDRSKFTKMLKHSERFHLLLSKKLSKPYDQVKMDDQTLNVDLDLYLQQVMKMHDRTTNERVAAGSSKSASKSTKSKQRKSNKTSDPTHSPRPNKKAKTTAPEKETSAKNREIVNIGSDVKVSFDLGETRNIKLVIDESFKSIQIDKSICDELLPVEETDAVLTTGDNAHDACDVHDSDNLGTQKKLIPSASIILHDSRNTQAQFKSYHSIAQRNKLNNFSEIGCDDQVVADETESRQFPSDRNSVCSVCNDNFHDPAPKLSCENCGLSVHIPCYGVSITEKACKVKNGSSGKWLCDPCSNDLNPVVSTSYNCCLCFTEGSNSGGFKKDDTDMFLKALKLTTSGSWCHVICSFFNKGIYYVEAKKLQPAVNVTDVIMKNMGSVCSICRNSGGGLVCCEDSAELVHASCAQEHSDYRLLFKKTLIEKEVSEHTSGLIIDESDGLMYQISPVILDKLHKQEGPTSSSYHSLSSTMGRYSMLEVYARSSKQNCTRNMILTRYLEQKQLTIQNFSIDINMLLEHDKDLVNFNKPFVLRKIESCKKCHSTSALTWYSSDLCQVCHLNDSLDEVYLNGEGDESMADREYISKETKKELKTGINETYTDLH